MNDQIEEQGVTREENIQQIKKIDLHPKSNLNKNFSALITKQHLAHQPRTVSQIIYHFPIMISRFLSTKALDFLFRKKDSCMFVVDDVNEITTRLPVQFSPSLDLALVVTLLSARHAGKATVLVVPTTTHARKLVESHQTTFGPTCLVATTISSLTNEVSCELFSDARIIFSTPGSLLRTPLKRIFHLYNQWYFIIH